MNYLIAGLAKSGTTILFSRIRQALSPGVETFFEPDSDDQLADILISNAHQHTLTKVLIGRVTCAHEKPRQFDRHVIIYRDPRDQFISMLLYLFYDFQVSGDVPGYQRAQQALARKVDDPGSYSTIELYNLIAELVGRAPIQVFNNLHTEQRKYIEKFSPHPIQYEDFIDGSLQKLEQYLGLTLETQVEVPQEYQRVARSRAYGEWENWLTDKDLDYVNANWGETIQDLGYCQKALRQEQHIEPTTSLDYVSQFDPSQ